MMQERTEEGMFRGRRPLGLAVSALLATITVLAGCGGGDGFPGGGGNPPPPPPPPVGTAQIAGVVVDSENVNVRLQGADVRLEGDAATALTDNNGQFRLRQLPDGGVNVEISFPSDPNYQPMVLTIDTESGKTTNVTIAALRSGTSIPNYVTLSPVNPTVDVGGTIDFQADVRAAGVPLDIAPTFQLLGAIGVLQADGHFAAQAVGTGTVSALVPLASAASVVTVVGPRPPAMGILAVSPASLPAEGGQVRIAVTATDGDGIASVLAQIEKPNRQIETVPLALETGTTFDGSWGTSYVAPANSSPPDPDGHQLEQRYSVRVKVTDNARASVTSQWTDFTVAGLDSPPPPP